MPDGVRSARRRRDPPAPEPRPAAVVRRARGPTQAVDRQPDGRARRSGAREGLRQGPRPGRRPRASSPMPAAGHHPRRPRGRPRRRRPRCGDEPARPHRAADRARATSTTSRGCSGWPTCIRTRRRSSRGCATCSSARPHPSGVTLSTIHRVKGREWDRVAVFGVADGICRTGWPTMTRRSAGSSTSPSHEVGIVSSCSPTARGAARSSTSSPAPHRSGRHARGSSRRAGSTRRA